MNATEIQFALNLNALSVPQCRRIAKVLIKDSCTLNDLSKASKLSPASVEKHLGILKDAGLVKVRKVDGTSIVTLQMAKLEPTIKWFSQLTIKAE